MRKLGRVLTALMALMLLLSGACIRSVSVDDRCFVLDVGMEYGDVLPYRYLFLCSLPAAGSSEEEGSTILFQAEAHDIYEAIDAVSAGLNNRLDFSRCSLIVFSRKAAEAGEIPKLMDFDYTGLRLSGNLRVLIGEDPLTALFEGLDSAFDPTQTKVKSNTVLYAEDSGYIVDTSLSLLLEAMDSKTQDEVVAYLAATEEPLTREDLTGGESYPYLGGSLLAESDRDSTLMGCAVFAGGRMVGLLDGQNTLLVRLMRGDLSRGRLRFTTENGSDAVLSVKQAKKPLIQFSGTGFAATLYLTARLETPAAGLSKEEASQMAKQLLAAKLTRLFLALQAVGADSFGLGKHYLLRYSDTEAWEALDFAAVYRCLTATFIVELDWTEG